MNMVNMGKSFDLETGTTGSIDPVTSDSEDIKTSWNIRQSPVDSIPGFLDSSTKSGKLSPAVSDFCLKPKRRARKMRRVGLGLHNKVLAIACMALCSSAIEGFEGKPSQSNEWVTYDASSQESLNDILRETKDETENPWTWNKINEILQFVKNIEFDVPGIAGLPADTWKFRRTQEHEEWDDDNDNDDWGDADEDEFCDIYVASLPDKVGTAKEPAPPSSLNTDAKNPRPTLAEIATTIKELLDAGVPIVEIQAQAGAKSTTASGRVKEVKEVKEDFVPVPKDVTKEIQRRGFFEGTPVKFQDGDGWQKAILRKRHGQFYAEIDNLELAQFRAKKYVNITSANLDKMRWDLEGCNPGFRSGQKIKAWYCRSGDTAPEWHAATFYDGNGNVTGNRKDPYGRPWQCCVQFDDAPGQFFGKHYCHLKP